jgi:hypothetical protein
MMKANSNTGFKTLAPWGIFYCTPGERTNPLRAITKASRCVASKQIHYKSQPLRCIKADINTRSTTQKRQAAVCSFTDSILLTLYSCEANRQVINFLKPENAYMQAVCCRYTPIG